MADPMLFDRLPKFPVALPDDELFMLARLPEWPTTQEVYADYHNVVRRLERRGLVKVQRQSDGLGGFPEWWAGKLPTASLRKAALNIHKEAP